MCLIAADDIHREALTQALGSPTSKSVRTNLASAQRPFEIC